MISHCVMASSALVGSSAMSSAGECMTAMAISTRCAWPTLICDGIARAKFLVVLASPTADQGALRRQPPSRCAFPTRGSSTLPPTGSRFSARDSDWTPDSAESGQSRGRECFSSRARRRPSNRDPRNRMLSGHLPPFEASRRRIASAIVLLPEPLSPISPSTSPGWT